MIELRDVSKRFEVGGKPVHALRNVDLLIERGEYVSIMGVSGSGKSSLMNIVGCLDRPTSGAYLLDGEPVGSLGERARSAIRRYKIGFVFQAFHLVPRLTAAHNVELPMLFAGVSLGERRKRVTKALDAVGLLDRKDHRPAQLSGGEQQRVSIARAIVMDPAVLLADEPTGNLDSRTGGEVISLLEGLNAAGRTLVIVSHDLAFAQRARRQLKLSDGVIVSDTRSATSVPAASGVSGVTNLRHASA
jgi:putative ABC transport system ATP-binding protein